MAETVTVEGKLAGLHCYDYKGFVGGDGKPVKGGTVWQMCVVKSFGDTDGEPINIKVPGNDPALLLEVEEAGFGATLRATYEIRAKDSGKIERRLARCEVLQVGPKAAPSIANGTKPPAKVGV